MVIKSKTNINANQTLQLNNSKDSIKETTGNPGDSISIGQENSIIKNLLKRYKHVKEEQCKEKEPWWEEVADAAHIQGDVVHGLHFGGKIAMVSTLGSGLGAVGLGTIGFMEMKEGIKEKDSLKIIGGGSAILAGASSGADFILGGIEAHGLFGTTGIAMAGSLETAGKICGITHGTIDVATGGREIIKGIKNKNKEEIIDGSLEIGIGSTMIMSALGVGGTAAPIALGAIFTAKLAYDHRESIAKFGKKLTGKE